MNIARAAVAVKHQCVTGILLLVTLGTAAAVDAAQVTAARLWPSQEYSRVTLEASGPIGYRMFTIPDPVRLVLDLELLDSSAALESLPKLIPANDPFIRAVRLGKFRPGTLRLVFDMKTAVRPEVFLLKPVGEYGYRLVLDVYSIDSEDPIVALIRNVERERRAEVGPVPPVPEHAATGAVAASETANAARIATDSATTGSATDVSASDSSKPDAKTTEDSTPRARHQGRRITVAIDAGHGGEDPGASGREGHLEKHVTLSIARRLKARVDDEPGMRAVLIRDGDYFIPLQHRVAKARAIKADAFVSIHADSFVKPHARGSSVFALSERGATSAAARWIAKRENDADLVGGVNIDVADPYLKKVLLDLSQTATINDSLFLARAVLDELGDINTLHKSHVEQAGFAVLKSPDVPSILVETAFISNPEEEKRLVDDEYQEKIAAAIFRGLQKFLVKQPAAARTITVRNEATTTPPAATEDIATASYARPTGGLQTVSDVPTVARASVIPAVHVVTHSPLERTARNDGARSTRAVSPLVERRTRTSATSRRTTHINEPPGRSDRGVGKTNRSHRANATVAESAKRKDAPPLKSKSATDIDCKSNKKANSKSSEKCGATLATQKRKLASRD